MSQPNSILVSEMIRWIDQILRLLPPPEAEFDDDPARYGVASLLINLGECAKRASCEVRGSLPAVPWKEMAGMRDNLAHNTTSVDYGKVWKAINDLPRVKAELAAYLDGRLGDKGD